MNILEPIVDHTRLESDGYVEIYNSSEWSEWLVFTFPSSQVERLNSLALKLLPNCHSPFDENKLFVKVDREKKSNGISVWDLANKQKLEEFPSGRSLGLVELEIVQLTQVKNVWGDVENYRYEIIIKHVRLNGNLKEINYPF